MNKTSSDVNKIREKMNEYGKLHLPYLFVINFEMNEGYFIENPTNQTDVLFSIHGQGNKPETKPSINESWLNIFPIGLKEYKSRFDIVHKRLNRGDSFLTNLTVKTPIKTNLSLNDIFLLSTSPYQLYIPNKFVCFSPESFVSISDRQISTFPMKGTIDASITNAENIILNDYKETAEHNTIVDLLRNDLSIIADNVHVKRYRYIDKIRTNNKDILQVSSEIVGSLAKDYHSKLGDIIFGMLPAGSVSGAPKTSTVSIIQSAEKKPRGYYTGIFGYYDGNTLDSGVMIRFIEQNNDQLFFRSGGGITVYSKWENEYQELLDKIYLPFL